MLSIERRTELEASLRWMKEHPYAAIGDPDWIAQSLADDDRELFDCSEAIARGDGCEACGAIWTPAEEGQNVRKLDHGPGCLYTIRVTVLDEAWKEEA